jgi:hypothetical protein
LRAAITHKHPGAVGRAAGPESERSGETLNSLQSENRLGLTLANLYASNRFLVGDQIVEVKKLAVGRPNWIADRAGRLGEPD